MEAHCGGCIAYKRGHACVRVSFFYALDFAKDKFRSADGGKTIHDNLPEMSSRMEKAAKVKLINNTIKQFSNTN